MGHKKVERIDPLTMAQASGGCDSHAHLDDPAFDADRDAVLERARRVGVSTLINIFLDPLTFNERRHLFDAYPWVFFALGMHPCDGQKASSEHMALLEKALDSERLIAVGEIGLDYYWKDCPHELQYALFSDQLAIARKHEKPVIIHCRDADEDCLMLLEAKGFCGYPVLWHCFGGDKKLAARIIKNGWFISIPGPATYPKNETLREAIAHIPLDRLLIETDCPYLAPHPWRGTRNEPAYTVFTAEAVAHARGMSIQDLWQATGETARRFFGLG
ncbi:MAG: TatD family hydrolase [Desulfovibrionaceae bacterium]|nr:TatD family hydrolase [Desulfovibrionaceae bacterium]